VWLRQSGPIQFILIVVAASFLVLAPYGFLLALFPDLAPGPGSTVTKYGVFVQVSLGVLLAPLLETAVFQALPIELLSRKTAVGWPVIILISSVFFGAAHHYSRGYMLAAFLIGLVFSYAYFTRRSRGGRPFLLVFAAHALRNSVSLSLFALGVVKG
jgi:cytochrome bd-type quinol oxidase subunit 1